MSVAGSGPKSCSTQSPRSAAPGDAPKYRLLLVDDDRDSVEVLGQLFEGLGHVVKTACDAVEALAVAPEFRPDAALLDIGLPGMNGYELAERLREIPGLENMKLVAMTGDPPSTDSDARRAFDAHVMKPFDMPKIASVLQGILHSATSGDL